MTDEAGRILEDGTMLDFSDMSVGGRGGDVQAIHLSKITLGHRLWIVWDWLRGWR